MHGKRDGKIDTVDLMADPTPETVRVPGGASEEPVMDEERIDAKTKVQTLVSLSILLSGLFIGSLFVDVAQLMTREGYSRRAVRSANILESAGKTWVAYADPKVSVKVITDDTCEKCSPDEALVWFRRILPTMEATPFDASSDDGKALISEFGIKTLPAFIFSGEIAGTDFYAAAEEIFSERDGSYIIDTIRLGIPPGKYVSIPEVGEDAIVIGSRDASLSVVEYADFQCPYCKSFHPTADRIVSEYGDRIAFVHKQLPLPFHAQAETAALASECANEQGKFREYASMLFAKQAEWGVTQDARSFKTYAAILRLKTADFNDCLDSGKYADKVAADIAEAESFGVDGTPGIFVGNEFFSGAVPYDQIREAIDAALAE